MSKTILKSLFIMVALLTVSVGSTNSYFSDSKVISGNVLSTGNWVVEPPEPKKVDVCHLEDKKDDNYHLISISVKALQAHLNHGDDIPGEFPFTDDCSVWVVVDTVEVPATTFDGIDSTFVPESGEEYLFRASGEYRFANWGDFGVADAEWAYRNDIFAHPTPPDDWTVGETSYPSVLGLDVLVDGTNVDWGEYSSVHQYKLVYDGTGTLIHFNIHDSNYTDNSGGVTVEIFELNVSHPLLS